MAGFLGLVDKLLGSATKLLGDDSCEKTVIYESKRGGRTKIFAVFDNQFEAVDPDTERVVTSLNPVIGVRLRDLPQKPIEHDIVIARNVRYRVIDIQEDGVGGASLILHKDHE